MLDNDSKLLFYRKGDAYLGFNFHPTRSRDGLLLPVPEEGEYQVVMSSDDYCYGGQGRIHHLTYTAQKNANGKLCIRLYLPSRTAALLEKK